MADKWCVYCFIFKQESRDSPFLCPPSGWLLGHAPFPAPPLIKQEYTPNIMIFVIGRAKPELGTRHRSLHPCPNNKKKRGCKERKKFPRLIVAGSFWLESCAITARHEEMIIIIVTCEYRFFSLFTCNLLAVFSVRNTSESNVTCRSSITNESFSYFTETKEAFNTDIMHHVISFKDKEIDGEFLP